MARLGGKSPSIMKASLEAMPAATGSAPAMETGAVTAAAVAAEAEQEEEATAAEG